ncbi:MAG: 5-formyltetrahydrofolate cyclo-ligase [Verrucomicrobia bacterium]|nr:MAG: 5-formyltetrahydrofolate cyclo-ligase [Verrucomicrobiota bacterium]
MILTAPSSPEISVIRQRKADLRSSVKATLARMDRCEVISRSTLMRESLYASELWQSSRSILLFASIASEPDLIPTDFQDKQIYCLRSIHCHYEPVLIFSREDLKLGPRGIREPTRENPFPLNQIDLIVVPGLAFDRKGGRLGRGGGHYDRILGREDCTGKVVGACFVSQIVPEVPREAHDSLVMALLTENGLETV